MVRGPLWHLCQLLWPLRRVPEGGLESQGLHWMSEETGPRWFSSLLKTMQGSRWGGDLKGANHPTGCVTLTTPLSLLSPCCGIVGSLGLILALWPERDKITPVPGAQKGSAKTITGGAVSVASCLPQPWAGPPVLKLCVQLLQGAGGPGLGAGSRL